MVSLWPQYLSSNKSSIDTFLRTQASELPNASEDRLYATVEQLVIENVFIFSFQIYPRGRPEHTYELFRLRSQSGQFPVALEINHFSGTKKNKKAKNSEELACVLREVFSDEKTIDILKILSDGAPQQDNGYLDGSPILIGERMFKGGNGLLYAMASFFGVSSFIEIDVIRRLIGEPDTSGSAYVTLGSERFVATIPVSGALKMTLTRKQLESLQSAARTTLSTEELVLKDE